MNREIMEDALLFVALLLNGSFMYGIAKLGKVSEWHHGFLGLGLVLGGIVLDSLVLETIGITLLVDDAWQHHRKQKVPEYLSPLNLLWCKIATKYPWTLKVGAALDWLCGKR